MQGPDRRGEVTIRTVTLVEVTAIKLEISVLCFLQQRLALIAVLNLRDSAVQC